MSLGRTLSVALAGLSGTVVEVEADVSAGLPTFNIVGLPDSSTLQARERVRAACGQIGHPVAARRITLNLIPARWCQPSLGVRRPYPTRDARKRPTLP